MFSSWRRASLKESPFFRESDPLAYLRWSPPAVVFQTADQSWARRGGNLISARRQQYFSKMFLDLLLCRRLKFLSSANKKRIFQTVAALLTLDSLSDRDSSSQRNCQKWTAFLHLSRMVLMRSNFTEKSRFNLGRNSRVNKRRYNILIYSFWIFRVLPKNEPNSSKPGDVLTLMQDSNLLKFSAYQWCFCVDWASICGSSWSPLPWKLPFPRFFASREIRNTFRWSLLSRNGAI